MKSIGELENNINKLVEQNKDLKLIKKIVNVFEKKGLNANVPRMLFQGDLDVIQLNKIELIGLASSLYEITELQIYRPTSYFTSIEMDEYELMAIVPEVKLQQAIFPHTRRMDSYHYLTTISAKELHDILDNKLLGYNKSLQRPPVEVRMGRSVVKRINVDKKKVEELKDRLVEKKSMPTPTQIILSVVNYGGKLDMSFNGSEYDGRLVITPNFSDKENPTKFFITDGFHRITAVDRAYTEYFKKDGKELDYTLTCLIQVATPDKIKQTVADSFKVNIPKEEEIKRITPSANNKFIDNLIAKVDILDGRVSESIIAKSSNYYTSKDILYKTMDYIKDIDLSDDIAISLESDNLAKIVNALISRIEKCCEEMNIDIKRTFLLTPNIFVIYFFMCNQIMKKKELGKIQMFAENFVLSTQDNSVTNEIESLKLNKKNCNLKEAIRFFENYVAKEENINV